MISFLEAFFNFNIKNFNIKNFNTKKCKFWFLLVYAVYDFFSRDIFELL